MKLEDNYYKLISMHTNGMDSVFRIALCPDCEVYRGHFPGNPVCPGVCNIQTIKECAERLTGQRLHISVIKRCRLKAIATPATCSELEIRISLLPTEKGYDITATVSDTQQTYIEYKGEMNV